MYLTRTDEGANLNRFYRMDILQGLFGNWALEREWGRIGSSGQVCTDWFDNEAEAKQARFALQTKKAKRGYQQEPVRQNH